MATMVSGLGGPAGYGENVFSTTGKVAGNNDNGSVLVDTTSVFGPSGIDFFGTSYTELYINSNGNLSFGAAQTTRTPDLAGTTNPTISAFWADVNINAGGEIYWDIDPTAGTITVTWLDVAPRQGTGQNSFQLVLTSTGGGDFELEYIYEDIVWTAGRNSGNVAEAGYTDGGANDTALEGSGNQTALAGYETNDFDGGDPAGAYAVTFTDGQPDFRDGTTSGTAGADLIDTGFTDAQGDGVDDASGAYSVNDTILAGAGDDTVIAGFGADSIDGGAGADRIEGDGRSVSSSSESLNWSAQGVDGDSIAGGFTQDTGDTNVTVSFADIGDNVPTFEVETTDVQYAAGGEPFAANSSALLFGDGDGATSRTTIDFAAATAGFQDAVGNVAFRINDLDFGVDNHRDQITVTAFDSAGNPVAVTLTESANDTRSGNTVTAGDVGESSADAGGSLLVEVAGPVSQIVIEYNNVLVGGTTSTHGVNITDVHFDTLPQTGAGAADTITGGTGNDTILGQEGDDLIDGGADDDSIAGGTGSDTITGGTGNDSILGGLDPNGGGTTGIGTNTQGPTFTVINLGTFADVDANEGDGGISENAASLLGSYGGAGAELYNNFQTATVNDTNADDLLADNDGGATPETFTIGGTTYALDSTQVYNATVTFTDGSTGTFTAVVSQTTTGEVFMMPEITNNADNALLTSGVIESISLDTISVDNTGLTANRLDADYQVPTPVVDTDTSADSIDGGAGDDTLDGGAGDDTLIGGTGVDDMTGGLGDDIFYVAEGDLATGGDGDDTFILSDLSEPGSSTITVTGGETGETLGDTLDLAGIADRTTLTFTNTDDNAGGLSGTITLLDGTVVSFNEIENIICYTPGTQILTANGPRPVESLRPGDLIVTRDHGPRPLSWVGRSTVPAQGQLAPIRLTQRALPRADRDLLVSPQHRFVLGGWRAELLFGTSEVLVSAKHLLNTPGVTREPGGHVTYIHLMFDRHEVIYAENTPTESFFLGDLGMTALQARQREEIFAAFPHLRADLSGYGPTARPCARSYEGAQLIA